jgi:cell division ATPase FtsA
MTILVGYRITPAAILESPHIKDMQCFIEAQIQLTPDILDRQKLVTQLDERVKTKFGSRFSITLVDPETEMEADDWDETALILVDAQTISVKVH